MTDDSLNTPSNTPQKRPVKRAGNATSGKKAAGKPGAKPALKLPPFLAKIPLPYLGGGVAAIVMVLFIGVYAMMTPLPDPPQQQQTPPPAQESTSPATPPAAAVPAPTAPVTTAPVPAYGGPSEMIVSGVDAELPLISPYGQTYTELGRRVRMDLAAFEQATTLYEMESIGGGTPLGYGFRLPKDWVPVGQGLSGTGIGVSDVLASFTSPPLGGMRQFFKVEVQKIPFKMGVKDLMALRAKADLITYQAMSVYGQNRAEAVYVMTEDNVSYVVRTVSILSGDRVLTADYRVPADQFETEQDRQTWAVTRFYVIDSTENAPIETKPADFLDLGSFQYPATWRVQSMDIQTLERMHISVSNIPPDKQIGISTILNGQIDVVMFVRDSKNSESRMIDMMNSLVSEKGVHLGEPIGRFDVESLNVLQKIFARVYPLIDQNGIERPYQYWLLQVKGPKRFFMIGLFTPIRDQNLKAWAENYAAFQTVIKTVKEAE